MDISGIDAFTGGALSLLLASGPIAKIVVFILFLFSVVSWTIIFFKMRQLGKVEKEGNQFMKSAREAGSFRRLLTTYKDSHNNVFYKLVIAAYKTIPLVENALRITISEESARLERRLSFLATTANTAPFIGLFGTVWGIMDSFREIGVRGSTSLAVVAPGISEALIATAIGLATAIPAVLAYNYFLGRLKRILSLMENSSMYIINILEK